MRVLAAGLVSGLLVALGLPPLGWWPAALAGQAVLVAVVLRHGWRQRVLAGAAAGVAQGVVGLWWVGGFSTAAAVGLVAFEALFPAAATGLSAGTSHLRRSATFVGATTLAGVLAAHWPFGGFPLASLAIAESGGPLAAVARLSGSPAVAAAAAAAGAAFALAAARRAVGSACLAGAVVAAVIAAAVVPAGGTDGSLRVAAVQGGGPEGTRVVDDDPEAVFGRQLAAAGRVAGPLDLVLLGEGVEVTDVPAERSYDGSILAALAGRTGAAVVAGVEQELGGRAAANDAVAWAPDGQVSGSYRKRHLVPFGEYVPLRGLLAGLVPQTPYDTVAGRGRPLLRAGPFRLGVLVSFEVFFDGAARAASAGELLVVPTDTSSYTGGQVPAEELAASRLAAIATGRWLVQAAPTGISAVVAPDGRVVAASRRGVPAVVAATVERRRGATPFDVAGDWPALVLAGSAVAGARRVRRRPTA